MYRQDFAYPGVVIPYLAAGVLAGIEVSHTGLRATYKGGIAEDHPRVGRVRDKGIPEYLEGFRGCRGLRDDDATIPRKGKNNRTQGDYGKGDGGDCGEPTPGLCHRRVIPNLFLR